MPRPVDTSGLPVDSGAVPVGGVVPSTPMPRPPTGKVMGGIEIALEDTIVEHIAYWTQEDVVKVKKTSKDPSYSDVAASGWEYGTAAVHAGMLPKNEVGIVLVDQIPVFPFILVHITKGKDMLSEGCIYTRIVVGAWDNDTDYQGYRDSVSLLRKVVRLIWYFNTLSNSYQMNMDEGTDWRIYDSNEVSWPFFISEATIGWRMRTPFLKAESEDLDYEPPSNIIPGLPASLNLPIWQPLGKTPPSN
jgi:hypothetical protein